MPNDRLKSVLRNSTKAALARVGLGVYRLPKIDTEDLKPAQRAGEFFPRGEVRFSGWTIPQDLSDNLAPWARTLVELYQRPKSWPASVVPEGGMLLHALVRNIQPRVIVETGTCLGASTIWMASAMQMVHNQATSGAALHTFDDFRDVTDPHLASSPLFKDRFKSVSERLQKAGVADIVRIHRGDSKVELVAARASLLAAGGVQLAFIDGDHSALGATADFQAIEPVLNVGGYVLFHDTFPDVCNHSGPRHVIDTIRDIATGTYQLCDLYTAQTNYGLGILRRIA